MAKVHGESKLTFLESTSIIIGHGVGIGNSFGPIPCIQK